MTRGQAVGAGFDPATLSIMPGQDVVHLHLLRHGSVERFTERRVRGQVDTPLSAEGHEQTERLVRWFATHEPRPDRILASDLSRCRVLAEQLAEATDAPLELLPALREQDMGAWEDRTWADLTAADGAAVTAWWDDYAGARPPGGESLEDTARRALGAWAERLPTLAGQRVVVVTHIGVLRAFLCAALGVPLGEALRFAPPAASHTALLLAEAGAVLNGLGERPWLDAAGASAARPATPATDSSPPGTGASAAQDPAAQVLRGPPRVALSGSAGTGKSTLGRRLADALDVPFLEETMRTRIEGGLDLGLLGQDGLTALLREMWDEQREREDRCTSGFVTDHASVDFAAFWLHYQLMHHGLDETEVFLAEVLQDVGRHDRVVLLPWGVLPLEHDGLRSTNRWSQYQLQSLIEGLITRHVEPARLLRMPPLVDLDARVARALAHCGRAEIASA